MKNKLLLLFLFACSFNTFAQFSNEIVTGPEFNINVQNGLSRNLLSVGGTNVDLWYQDDNSGRQKWIFEFVGVDVYKIFYIKSDGTRMYLTSNGGNVFVAQNNNTNNQVWIIDVNRTPVAEYTIKNKAYNKFLSVGGTNVNLWYENDGSGRQVWGVIRLN